jgi:predicted transport protein
MSDIKLFRLGDAKEGATELEGTSVAVEKSLQVLIERHLKAFLGVEFLATEYGTGPKHGGRIDTLGIDENGCPVIIEYKRSLNENVINQGLYYLDWLMDHKAEFKLLVLEKVGKPVGDEIEWGGPRLLCIAGDFTKYDSHAVSQINRNIELIRYKRYGDELLLLELVNAVRAESSAESSSETGAPTTAGVKSYYKPVSQLLADCNPKLRDCFEALKALLLGLGDDVQLAELRYYFAFKRIKNFACVQAHPKANLLLVWLKLEPSGVALEEGFTRDVSGIGHQGTGDLELTLRTADDLERAKPLLLKSYEAS